MSFSNLRILCGLILSIPMATGIALLSWGMQSNYEYAYIFNFGVFYALVMMCLVLAKTFKSMAVADKENYNQKKLDIILSSIKYLDGNNPITNDELANIDLDSIEFDYFPTNRPENFDQGSIQL